VSGDQIVAVIAIMGMLLLVVPRLVNNQTPMSKMLRMALLWALIIAVIAVIVMVMRPGGT
jgi:predicted neutral ceramidase superfamily lipid hydrolase